MSSQAVLWCLSIILRAKNIYTISFLSSTIYTLWNTLQTHRQTATIPSPSWLYVLLLVSFAVVISGQDDVELLLQVPGFHTAKEMSEGWYNKTMTIHILTHNKSNTIPHNIFMCLINSWRTDLMYDRRCRWKMDLVSLERNWESLPRLKRCKSEQSFTVWQYSSCRFLRYSSGMLLSSSFTWMYSCGRMKMVQFVGLL